MATIYDWENYGILADGLQGSRACDEAINSAKEIAAEREEQVILSDDDGDWLVHPDGTVEEFEFEADDEDDEDDDE